MAFAHGQAARRAAENATYDELTGLTELHERLVQAHREGRTSDLVALNWEFHRTVNRIARAPKILTVIRTVAMSMPRDHLAAFPDLIPEANAQKAAVIAAMKQRDG